MKAILFPGQGSQFIAMGADLAEKYAIYSDTLNEASDALGFDMVKLINDGPEEVLTRTDMTQPAILTISVAGWRLITSMTDIKADYMAGHSLGEYSALVCSGALGFADAVKLVNLRGQLMLKAVPEGMGTMAAILGLNDEQITAACAEAAGDEVVSPVNYNSPGQVVIAGHTGAVERACQSCLDLGAKKAIPLVVSGPFHSALMQPAAEKLAEALAETQIRTPEVSVVNNVDVISNDEPEAIRDALIRQLYNPVRWSETIQWFEANSVDSYIECGPGKVLAGLVKRFNRRAPVHLTTDLTSFEKILESMNNE